MVYLEKMKNCKSDNKDKGGSASNKSLIACLEEGCSPARVLSPCLGYTKDGTGEGSCKTDASQCLSTKSCALDLVVFDKCVPNAAPVAGDVVSNMLPPCSTIDGLDAEKSDCCSLPHVDLSWCDDLSCFDLDPCFAYLSDPAGLSADMAQNPCCQSMSACPSAECNESDDEQELSGTVKGTLSRAEQRRISNRLASRKARERSKYQQKARDQENERLIKQVRALQTEVHSLRALVNNLLLQQAAPSTTTVPAGSTADITQVPTLNPSMVVPPTGLAPSPHVHNHVHVRPHFHHGVSHSGSPTLPSQISPLLDAAQGHYHNHVNHVHFLQPHIHHTDGHLPATLLSSMHSRPPSTLPSFVSSDEYQQNQLLNASTSTLPVVDNTQLQPHVHLHTGHHFHTAPLIGLHLHHNRASANVRGAIS